MNRFKDFFYNKNDIIIAIVILIIAAGVIYFRIQAIMNYPDTLTEHNQSSTVQEADLSAGSSVSAATQSI